MEDCVITKLEKLCLNKKETMRKTRLLKYLVIPICYVLILLVTILIGNLPLIAYVLFAEILFIALIPMIVENFRLKKDYHINCEIGQLLEKYVYEIVREYNQKNNDRIEVFANASFINLKKNKIKDTIDIICISNNQNETDELEQTIRKRFVCIEEMMSKIVKTKIDIAFMPML